MRRIFFLLATCATMLTACHGGHDAPVSAAQTYFQDHLHVATATVIASRTGDECAVVSLRAPDGNSQGVAVVLQGRPIRWEAVGMSASLHLSDYKDDGNVQCGLANVSNAGTRGSSAVVGAFTSVGGPAGATSIHLDGRIEVHADKPTGAIVAVGAAHHGAFRVKVPPGRYWLVGRSPQITVNGEQERCQAEHDVRVRLGRPARVDVFCQIR